MTSLIKEAREIARHCPKLECAKILRDDTDELADVCRQFAISNSREDMQALVAAWTRVLLDIAAINKLGDDPTPQGRLQAPLASDHVWGGRANEKLTKAA